jgi:hypothetical protein
MVCLKIPFGLVVNGEICEISLTLMVVNFKTHDIDRLRKTCQSQIIVLPDQHVQPSDESEHVAIIVDLSQTILSMTLELVPDIPFVECDLDRSGG